MQCKFCSSDMTEGSSVCPVCGRDQQENAVQAKTVSDPGHTKGIVSLVLGIISLLNLIVIGCCTYGLSSFLSLIMSIVGIILGKNAMKASKNGGFGDNNMAKVGYILSIVSTVLSALTVVLVIVFIVLYFLGITLISFGDFI